MSELKLRAALSAQLATLGLPTQYENAKFTPTAGVTYLVEQVIPASNTSGIANSDSSRLTGIYQVTVMAPRETTKGEALAKAALIGAAFKRGMILSRDGQLVQVQRCEYGPTFIVGDRYALPVSVYYFASVAA